VARDSGGKLSREEVEVVLRRARADFNAYGFVVGSPLHTFQDFQELGLFSYCGPHPPDHVSKEPKCRGARMIQFAWNSECFDRRRMYLKFCLKDSRFVLLRIHQDYKKR
jgi:hypothetical protein